jgi:hypothetical protein
MPRYSRYLRIGWTVLCGIACALLIVMWVRSYWISDSVYWHTDQKSRVIFSHTGSAIVHVTKFRNFVDADSNLVGYHAAPVKPINLPTKSPSYFGFRFENNWAVLVVEMPIWFLVVLSASLAALAWIRWRYSLKTLLLATTALAVVLGAIVWTSN